MATVVVVVGGTVVVVVVGGGDAVRGGAAGVAQAGELLSGPLAPLALTAWTTAQSWAPTCSPVKVAVVVLTRTW